MLVVFEQDIVAGLMFLDEVAFQNQRFGFCFGGQELDITDFIQKHSCPGMKNPRTLEIGTDPVPQNFCLTNIKNSRPGILHDINSG